MSTAPKSLVDRYRSSAPMWYLQVIEDNHLEEAFYRLGETAWPTKQQAQTRFDGVPAVEEDPRTQAEYCVILIDSDRSTVLADKAISADSARKLLGGNLAPLRRSAKRELADIEHLYAQCRLSLDAD